MELGQIVGFACGVSLFLPQTIHPSDFFADIHQQKLSHVGNDIGSVSRCRTRRQDANVRIEVEAAGIIDSRDDSM